MGILRDQLYTDKVLAVIREYSSNAWDSHRMSGKGDVPIKITLPTSMDPTLSIRDFGAGLSQQEVLEVYTQYGMSSKRGSNGAVGMLGIGSKSGFAYSDSFSITSFHGGTKKTYVAVLDKSEKGSINMLHEEPTDETGVLIQIAVRPKDIYEFTTKAKQVFQYFVPRPEINTELPEPPAKEMELANGIIYERWQRTGWVAVMGCVSYTIDLGMLRTENPEENVAAFLSDLSGALFFEIGEVQISASREALKDSDITRAALKKKFDALVDEYVTRAVNVIETGNFTPWQKRLKAQALGEKHLPLPQIFKAMAEDRVQLKSKVPDTLSIYQDKILSASTSIKIERDTRLIFRDDKRTIQGFNLRPTDYMVRPLEKATWATVETDLNKMIDDMGLTGITITKCSDLYWSTPRRGSGAKVFNEKHHLDRFKFLPNDSGWYHKPYSQFWEAATEEPAPTDVFIIIKRFEDVDHSFTSEYRDDKKLADMAGLLMPTVYGIKTTPKKPVDRKDCLGTHYSEWRKTFVKSLVTPDLIKNFNHWTWSEIGQESYHWRKYNEKAIEEMTAALGVDHPLTQILVKHHEGKEAMKAGGKKETAEEGLALIKLKFPKLLGTSEYDVAMDVLKERYPLFSLPAVNLSEAWGQHSEKWIHYIKAVDAALTPKDITP